MYNAEVTVATGELERLDMETVLKVGATDVIVSHDVGQALALQPGVSRSGATLTVARGLGYSRDAAARLVFLMSLPINMRFMCAIHSLEL